MGAISYAHRALNRVGLQLSKAKTFNAIAESNDRLTRATDLLRGFDPLARRLTDLMAMSSSQLYQDVFVLVATNFKRGGHFVEFGAANGIDLSNSYMLERDYGWTGILAEPGRRWHRILHNNRPSTIIDTDCVWSSTGEILEFAEDDELEFSAISEFSRPAARRDGKKYPVKTVSLLDLLRRHNAPPVIDYISIDTEGSELEILRSFDFNAYDIRIITVEHNYKPSRGALHALLTSHGYRRTCEIASAWDDWYIRD
jgi:FkbM family methyltransferase